MSYQHITITYEDGTVVETTAPDTLLLASAAWVDWLVAALDPANQRESEGADDE